MISPQKIVLNLNDVVSRAPMTSYLGTMKVLRCLEVDYKLDKIHCC